MAHYSSTTGELSQRGPSCDSQHPRSLLRISYQLLSNTWPIGNGSSSTRTPIHILDNDSLLNIFHFYRPAPSSLGENDADAVEILGGANWNHERWWYSLVQVCRRWRYLVLESAPFLGISLLCTYGTPVADMLAHLPCLPLIIDYLDPYDDLTVDDELGIILALWHCDRVRRIRLMQPVPVLQRLLMILQGEFPNLEYLFIEQHPYYWPEAEHSTFVNIPKTFRAPRLRYLVVMGLQISIGSPLFKTIGNSVALELRISFIGYLHPNILLQQLSVVRQRETPGNTFDHHLPSDDIDRQSLQRATMRRVTPYLRRFGFQGANAYLETLLPRVATRLLERLQLYFFNQLIYLIPRRREFMRTVEIPRLKSVMLTFLKDHSRVDAFSPDELWNLRNYIFSMGLSSRYLDWQVAHTAQVVHMLRTVFSEVERLQLRYDRHTVPISSEGNDEADRTQWRKLLRTFGNANTLGIDYGLIWQLSRSLQPGEGESPMDLLPELQRISYSTFEPSDDVFAQFVDACQKAGRHVTVVHR
ncbi:hypothetical protein F5888DRAFT_1808005 [Russula emetica]|nr:hypothetical protein F5888DRAFT_1808005 [Russula emetica]